MGFLRDLLGVKKDESGQREVEEEERKAALRRQIDAFYGIADSAQVPEGGGGGFFGNFATQVHDKAMSDNAALADQAAAARTSLEGENTKLGDATRAYYTDQLGRTFNEASRNTRFKLARQGLLGGSEEAFQQGEVGSDRDLGATRIDEAVRRAVASLKTQREQERLNAVGLVNAGAGDSAVSAAQTGLRNSLENANSQQKADIFGDLFSHSADAIAASNANDNEAARLARFQQSLNSFFPARTTTSGRVTPSS